MIDWKEKYMRDVEGLNNEGDPIGGNSPSELRAALEALEAKYEGSLDSIREHQQICRVLKQENAELVSANEQQAKRIAELEQAVKANHDHHFIYDEYNCYPDSELFNANVAALSAQKGTE